MLGTSSLDYPSIPINHFNDPPKGGTYVDRVISHTLKFTIYDLYVSSAIGQMNCTGVQ
jgi:hypothetical protein